ncbi:MAG: hypothetical protein JNJ84_16640 [Rhodobacteraceae bacterium]|jgi:hypothetical protein|nr:hypothetical protein [Paracoccaceae bacterium]
MRAPLFLARKVYRRRRLRDAARILPFLGLFLMLLPALWSPGRGGGGAAVFVFSVWALLIAGAAALAPGLARPEADSGEAEGAED